MAESNCRETDLYAPIKALLEKQGYTVKGEIGAADIVAVRGDDDPLIVELKTGFSLTLIHQGIDRQSITDTVYLAVPHRAGRGFRKALKLNRSLCRRLGLGLMTVNLNTGSVNLLLDPAPYKPRQMKPRKTRLLREFTHRVGDPNTGGTGRRKLMTAYRQAALRCARTLQHHGPTKASEVARLSHVERARRIMSDDHYGWFERVETGIYTLTPKGTEALLEFAEEVRRLEMAG